MRTELEKRLNQLETPTLPHDLKKRCLNTIPSSVAARNQTHKVVPRPTARPFWLRPIAVAGVLMFGAAAGIAFWNTQPNNDGFTRPAGSVVLAQVLEATQRVAFCHAKGSEAIPPSEQNPINRDWFRIESWFDAEKGIYTQTTQDNVVRSRSTAEPLATGASPYDRSLTLPDGTIYNRVGLGSTTYMAKDPNNWKAQSQNMIRILTGQVAGIRDLSGAQFSQVLSSTPSHWKGQTAQLLVLARQPAPRDAARGIGVGEARLYVNPETKLLIAFQAFAPASDGTFQMTAEYEFDYSRPDAALFDPQKIRQGAKVLPFPGHAKTEAEFSS